MVPDFFVFLPDLGQADRLIESGQNLDMAAGRTVHRFRISPRSFRWLPSAYSAKFRKLASMKQHHHHLSSSPYRIQHERPAAHHGSRQTQHQPHRTSCLRHFLIGGIKVIDIERQQAILTFHHIVQHHHFLRGDGLIQSHGLVSDLDIDLAGARCMPIHGGSLRFGPADCRAHHLRRTRPGLRSSP